jgi:hypothetical protein
MSSLPQGQDYYDLYSFRSAWEERYGELTSEQSSRFMRDPRLLTILLFHKYSVEATLDEFKNFDDIIKNLSDKLNSQSDYVEITSEDLGMSDPEPWATTLGELGLE